MRFVLRLLGRLPVGPVSRRALDELAADWHHERHAPRDPSRAPRPASRATLRTRASAGLGLVAGAARVVFASFASFEEHPMRHLGGDIRHGLRRLIAAPAFTIFSIVSLALGIGATTAIYSVVHALVFQPIPMRDIEQVVNIYHSRPPRSASGLAMSRPDFDDLRAQQQVFSGVTAWYRVRLTVSVAAGPNELFSGEAVDGAFFTVLGISSQRGRLIQPADDRPGSPAVAVISDAFWARYFARDPGAIGATMRIGGRPFEIVGVADAAFRGVDMPNVSPTPIWVPVAAGLTRGGRPRATGREEREARTLFVKARLRPDRTIADAERAVSAIAAGLDQAHPIGVGLQDASSAEKSRAWFVAPARAFHLHESIDRMALPASTLVLVAVGLVLLVACTNLANLVLARASTRRHELAVRLALGATRWRLVREHLIESTIVVLAGVGVSVLVARTMMVALGGSVELAPGVVGGVAPVFNLAVGFALLTAAALTVLVVGVVPAVRATRANVRGVLAAEGSSASLPRWRGRRILIAAQVTVSTLLIALAAIAVHEIIFVASRDFGYDVDRLAAAEVDFLVGDVPEVRARELQTQLLDRARLLPGVERVALASRLPLSRNGRYVYFETEGGNESRTAARLITATPEIFGTLGTSLVDGRAFDASATPAAAPVAVVSARLATQLFGGGPAVGRTVMFRVQPSQEEPNAASREATIVGVVEDTDTATVRNRRDGVMYLPMAQLYEPTTTIVARTPADPAGLVPSLRQLVHQVDPSLVVFEAGTARALGGADGLAPRIMAFLAGLLGALSCGLALAGLFGVLSQLVASRTREIGLRMALGADTWTIARMVLREGLSPVVLGLVAGLTLGVLARMGLAPLFRNLLPVADPLTVAVVAVLLFAAGGVACYLPARRAARVDPNVALRDA